MRTHATAQLIGDRSHQCDATATYTAPSGARAHVLLDGIGSDDEVRDIERGEGGILIVNLGADDQLDGKAWEWVTVTRDA